MKAVVMAGGNGSRLRPMLAASINKHLCPVGGKPMIHWPLQTIAELGITEVFIMGNGPRFLPIMEEVGTGKQFGLQVSYIYEPQSAGQSVGTHLQEIRSYIGREPFMLMLGDSVYLQPIPPPASQQFLAWAMPVAQTWDDMDKYPLVPNNPKLMQTGAWVFPPELFATLAKLSTQQEVVRIRDAVTAMCHSGHELALCEIAAESFIDCGTTAAVNKINSIKLC